MNTNERISKMCIAEIQKTFGVSRFSAMRLKKGHSSLVDLKKAMNFLDGSKAN